MREVGVGKSLLWRERAPRWVSLGSAALLLLLLVIGLDGALSADEPAAPAFSAETRQLAAEAAGNPANPPTPELAQAENAYAAAAGPANAANTARDQAREAVNQANAAVRRADHQLARAQAAAGRASRQLSRAQAAAAAAAAAQAAASAQSYLPPPVASGTTEDFGSGKRLCRHLQRRHAQRLRWHSGSLLAPRRGCTVRHLRAAHAVGGAGLAVATPLIAHGQTGVARTRSNFITSFRFDTPNCT